MKHSNTYAVTFVLTFIDDTHETAVIGNQKRGLVYQLQSCFEPLPTEDVSTSAPLREIKSFISVKMLARSGRNIHSTETACNPQVASSQQLGAFVSIREPNEQSEVLSSRRSTAGRALNSVPSAVNGAPNGIKTTTFVNKTAIGVPPRRYSEPIKQHTAPIMVTSPISDFQDTVDNKAIRNTKSMSWKNGISGQREYNEDEELQYGPGIVNKLKSRYLSRTLREKPLGESRRPSLRRYNWRSLLTL